ncbi:MAG: serine hydrolase [Candidatus Levyibacteriota bacterium]
MHKYEYRYKSPTQKDPPKKSVKIIQLFFILFFLTCFVLTVFVVSKTVYENVIQKRIISPVAKSITTSVAAIQKIIFPEQLEAVVSKALDGVDGDYAVAIKNLKTNESYTLNSNQVFQTASLYKMWVMAVVSQQIEKGKLNPSHVLEKDISKLNSAFGISTDSAELTEGTLELDIKSAMNRMIVVSNNYAALALLQEVGVSTVSSFLQDYGLVHSKTGNPPTTTVADEEQFLEDLYKGKFGNKESTLGMLTMLKNQEVNDRIPKYLPPQLEVGHKTGELDGYKHDVGIVFSKKGPYIIAVLTNTNDPQTAAENIAKLSKAVYQHFENE